jgi:branched-chain amino acid transport system ATP-binding protein
MLMPAETLEVRNLSAGYGSTHIIEDLSFSIEAGGKLAILGRNGMGKTTLLATLAGQTRRFDGTIRIGEIDITGLASAARAHAGLGYVPQTRDVFPSLSVEENLLVGLKSRPKDAISEAYDMFPRLRERRKNLGNQLSGGEQQMLSTARSILGRPSVLLLDEPLEGLAPVICDELMAALSQLAESRAMTILLVEQRIQDALDFADRVLVLERGRLAWQGSSADFSADRGAIDRLLGVGHL